MATAMKEVKVAAGSLNPDVVVPLPPTPAESLPMSPINPSRLITVKNRLSRADAKRVSVSYPLGERVSPIVSRFVEQIGGNPETFDAPTYRDALKKLEIPFEEIYTVFRKVRELGTEEEFDQFMQEFVRTVIQHQPVKNYLKDRSISISAHSNQIPNSARSSGKASRIGIRVGDFVQSVNFEGKSAYFSDLMQVKKHEDTPIKFDATIWVSDLDDIVDQVKKTNLIFKLLRWLLATRNGRIVASLILGAAFFGGLGGGLEARQFTSEPSSIRGLNQSGVI